MTVANPPSAQLRVAVYTRVSTDLQANKEEGSLDMQEARCRAALSARREPGRVTHVFREEGASGKSLDRPEVQRMLAAVRASEVDMVIVTRVDRLSAVTSRLLRGPPPVREAWRQVHVPQRDVRHLDCDGRGHAQDRPCVRRAGAPADGRTYQRRDEGARGTRPLERRAPSPRLQLTGERASRH